MKTKEIYMYVLGAVVVFGFFVVVLFKLATKQDTQIEIGSLIGAFGLVVGYFFGSSKGSADKTDAINMANAKLADNMGTKTN